MIEDQVERSGVRQRYLSDREIANIAQADENALVEGLHIELSVWV